MTYQYANEKRRMWKFIIFGILTLGIYDFVFYWNMYNDLNRVCFYVEPDESDKSPHYLVFILLTIVTLGIYPFVWYYKQGNRMKRAAERYGFIVDEKGSSYVLWILLGSLLFGIGPFVALYLFISNLNKLAKAYNHRVADSAGGTPVEPIGGNGNGAGTTPWSSVPVNDDQPTTSGAIGAITCIAGQYEGAQFHISPGEELVMGRNGEVSNIVLGDRDISRKHCAIRFVPDPDNTYYVTDYSSLGTKLNDSIRLPKGQMMKCPVGSKLSLGNGNNVFMLR